MSGRRIEKSSSLAFLGKGRRIRRLTLINIFNMTDKQKDEMLCIKKTIKILRKEFGQCPSYVVGCLQCDVQVAVDTLKEVLETYSIN